MTAFPISLVVNRPPRPLLARVAESAFWMARYVERAEHVARVLWVNLNSLLDIGDIEPEIERQFWTGPLRIFLVDQSPQGQQILAQPRETVAASVLQSLTLDSGNPSSILACITRARENARSIRENISAEMWEGLNTLYWTLRGDESSPGRLEEAPTEVLRQVMNGALLFQGLSDQTLAHGQIWQFIQLAKYLERIDVTCRVIQSKFDTLQAVGKSLETPERNMHLLSVVRSCCALEAFRRRSGGEIDADRIAAFLLLERRFPRSVCFSARGAMDAICAIHADTKPSDVDPAEAILGRLDAELRYAQAPEVCGPGLAYWLDKIQAATLDAVIAVKNRYFLQ